MVLVTSLVIFYNFNCHMENTNIYSRVQSGFFTEGKEKIGLLHLVIFR